MSLNTKKTWVPNFFSSSKVGVTLEELNSTVRNTVPGHFVAVGASLLSLAVVAAAAVAKSAAAAAAAETQ